jgi:hypothetical protein
VQSVFRRIGSSDIDDARVGAGLDVDGGAHAAALFANFPIIEIEASGKIAGGGKRREAGDDNLSG